MSTRLNADNRQSIKTAMLEYRFGKEIEALQKEQAAIAKLVYESVYTENERKLMLSLPSGWLKAQEYINVNFGGSSHHIPFNGQVYWHYYFDPKHEKHILKQLDHAAELPEVNYLFPYNGHGAYHAFPGSHPLAVRGDLFYGNKSDFEKAVEAASKQLDNALKSATTVEALIKSWPEVEPFAKRFVGTTATTNRQLPVLVRDRLNELLDLPVPTTEENSDGIE